MKFLKELSPERLSLLSQEERAIYEQEHAQKTHSSNIIQESGIEEIFINNPIEFEDAESYKADINEACDQLYDELLSDVLNFNNYEKIKENFISEFIENYNEISSFLYEAEGKDAYAWIRGLGLGKLGAIAAAGLAGLGTGIAYLLTQGKDRIAMARLKNYMNRLTELVDQGRFRRRPWYSFLIPSKKKRNLVGEYNAACFRFIQETAERNLCNSCMQAAHKLGFFAAGNMMSIANADQPQAGSGLDEFKQNVIGQLNVVIED